MHQVVIVRYGGLLYTGENSVWSTVLDRGLIHDPYGLPATVPGLRMGCENDRVSRLDGHDAFKKHRRCGVRDGYEREDQPDRFSHLHQTAFRKLADGAN